MYSQDPHCLSTQLFKFGYPFYLNPHGESIKSVVYHSSDVTPFSLTKHHTCSKFDSTCK